MPKRSNAFQRLIKYIHEQIEAAGGSVTESAFLLEQNIKDPVKREIDVLIERKVNSKVIRIAVECRDRGPKNDIQWIDQLIGKYLNLPIYRVIAVSNSGFTSGAVKKAIANKIELRTLKDALSTNWPKEFIKLGLAYVSRSFRVVDVYIKLIPTYKKTLNLTDKIYRDGKVLGTIKELLDSCTGDRARQNLFNYIREHMLEVFKTLADLKKSLMIEHKIPIKNLEIITSPKKTRKIQYVMLKIISKSIVKDIPMSFYDYEKARISKGVINIEGLDRIYSIYAAQMPESKELRVSWDSKKSIQSSPKK